MSESIVVVEATETIVTEVLQQGPAGPQGPQGSSGDAYFVHVQAAALATWSITHNLNKFPAVTVVDSGNNKVEGDVTYIDDDSLTISFSAPFGGKAYLS